jgi:DNA-binding NarL/FixJ family response regulator
MKQLRVLLADDRALVRAGFRSLLQGIQGITVVAEANDGREALRLIREHRPDIVLIDIGMPGMNGLEALRHVTKEFQGVKVIFLTMHADEEYVLEALKGGAAGYLLKDSPPAELEQCISAVAKGQTYFSPRVSESVLEYQRQVRGETVRAEDNRFQKLTLKQREVLQLIAEGHTTREIARIMGIGEKTVESHRTNLMRRLDIHGVASLTRYAIQKGMIRSDDLK